MMTASAQSHSVLQGEFNTSWATSETLSLNKEKKGWPTVYWLAIFRGSLGFISSTENSNVDHSLKVEVS